MEISIIPGTYQCVHVRCVKQQQILEPPPETILTECIKPEGIINNDYEIYLIALVRNGNKRIKGFLQARQCWTITEWACEFVRLKKFQISLSHVQDTNGNTSLYKSYCKYYTTAVTVLVYAHSQCRSQHYL